VWSSASGIPRDGGTDKQNGAVTISSLGVRLSAISPSTLHDHTALIYHSRHVILVRI